MLVIQGNEANITSPLTATVTALAASPNTPLIRVTTSAPHLFGNNDIVDMAASPAVGLFAITVIDGTHFDLQGSTYSSTGTGTATDESLTPAIQVPTDGDSASLQLSGMLSAIQALADRTQFNKANALTLQRYVFSYDASTQTLTVPPGCSWAIADMVGGGGGGEGGCRGNSAGTAQGGGGAAAPHVQAIFPVTPGDELTVHSGAGGTAGAASGGAGGDGGEAYITNQHTTLLASAAGGAGCGCGLENKSGGTISISLADTGAYTDVGAIVSPGAIGVAGSRPRQAPHSTGPIPPVISGGTVYWTVFRDDDNIPGRGGAAIAVYDSGSCLSASTAGGQPVGSVNAAADYDGGAPGAQGGTGVDGSPGIGGGGGGGSAFGNGGAGGNGGSVTAPGVGGAGSAGGNGNVGAGGGGGGCGAYGTGSSGLGAAGGAGGNSFVVLYLLSNVSGV